MKSTNSTSVAERFKAIRKILNISQREFAKRLEISNKTMSDIELGKTMPKFHILHSLYKLFKVNLNYVIMGTGEPFEQDRVISKSEGFIKHEEIKKNIELQTFLSYMLNSEFVRLKTLDYFKKIYREESVFIEEDVKKNTT